MNECRERGFLPLDITSEDVARGFSNLEHITSMDPEEYAAALLQWAYNGAANYTPESFWEDQDYYVEMLVEKIDLRELFKSTCADFRVPIANARGWSDLHTRAAMMRRFGAWEAEGKQPVLLYAGDFDPAGVLMSDKLIDNMKRLELAAGWDPSGLIVDRFGLNRDFIDANNLSWTENLMTGGKKDLANPRHHQHHREHIQRWLRDNGPRKVEANALVTRPEAGRQLCFDAITRYVSADAPEAYRERIGEGQEDVRAELTRRVHNPPWVDEYGYEDEDDQ